MNKKEREPREIVGYAVRIVNHFRSLLIHKFDRILMINEMHEVFLILLCLFSSISFISCNIYCYHILSCYKTHSFVDILILIQIIERIAIYLLYLYNISMIEFII